MQDSRRGLVFVAVALGAYGATSPLPALALTGLTLLPADSYLVTAEAVDQGLAHVAVFGRGYAAEVRLDCRARDEDSVGCVSLVEPPHPLARIERVSSDRHAVVPDVFDDERGICVHLRDKNVVL